MHTNSLTLLFFNSGSPSATKIVIIFYMTLGILLNVNQLPFSDVGWVLDMELATVDSFNMEFAILLPMFRLF